MKLLVRRFLSSVLVAAATVVSRWIASVGPGIRPGAVCRLPDRFILSAMRLFRSRVAVALVAVATFAAVSVPAIGAAEVREPEWDGTSHSPGWVQAENQREGTDAWRITNQNYVGFVEGYAGATSALLGEVVTLYVRTTAPGFTAAVYRMGYYGGTYARLVWTSDPVAAVAQIGRAHV